MDEDYTMFSSSSDLLEFSEFSSDLENDISSSFTQERTENASDYSSALADIYGKLNDIESVDVSVYSELLIMNESMEVMKANFQVANEHLMFTTTVLVLFTVFGFIKVVFTIFNKYLGLGQA